MRIENLNISFDNKSVFENFNLDIPDKACIMAPSGRGKTSFLMFICGLSENNASGNIIGAFQRPSVMFQDDRLLPWLTAFENINIVCDDADLTYRLLKEVELYDDKNSYPESLSGGMQRRVALARALAYMKKGADYLVLDEPFTGMDFELKKRMAQLILSYADKFIVSVHDEEEADLLISPIIHI